MTMVKVLDATLREGEQTPGVYFDGHIKLAIANMLDEIGIDIIEAGHPLVSREIFAAIKMIAGKKLNAVVGAHSRSLKEDVDMALDCGVGFLGIFYCVKDERLDNVFKTKLADAVAQIAKVIRYSKEQKPDLIVRYTPEDTVRSKYRNVLDAAAAAVQAGADIISIADTTGYMIPGTERNMYDYVSRLRSDLSDKGLHPKIALHCHNDRGFALANVIDGYRAGAAIIDVTILGLGERAGLVDLAQLLLVLVSDFKVENRWKLEKLPALYELVSSYTGIPIPENYPVVGKNAFTHCAGVHTHAATKDPLHYQSIDPTIVGRNMDIALDHMSGLSSVVWALEKIGVELDKHLAKNVLDIVKSIGQKGRTVGLAELPFIVEWCREYPESKSFIENDPRQNIPEKAVKESKNN